MVPGKEKKTVRKLDLKNDQLNYTFTYNDEETKALHEKLNDASSITIDDLRRISLWKLGRVMSVPDETLQKLVALSKNKNVTIDDI